MQYYKDLIKLPWRARASKIIGIAFFLIAVSWILTLTINSEQLSVFDWVYASLMLLTGVYHFMAGLGYPLERQFGSAFVKISNDGIRVKTEFLGKEETVFWRDVESIQYSSGKFYFSMGTGESKVITLSKVEYADLQEIKNMVTQLAGQKNIPLEM